MFILIDDLNDSDNMFVVIQPDDSGPAWFTSTDQIARDLTIWMAARDFPGRPA